MLKNSIWNICLKFLHSTSFLTRTFKTQVSENSERTLEIIEQYFEMEWRV